MLVTRPLSNILVLVELSLGIMYLKTTKHNFPYQMKIRKGGKRVQALLRISYNSPNPVDPT